jgi:hypothetical protein
LRAIRTFEPSEPELREALDKVEQQTTRLRHDATEWLDKLQQTDLLMFKTDPDGWRAAHAAADNESIFVMRDDDGDDPAYQVAINAIWQETWDDYGSRRDEIPEQQKIAACEAKPEKRTKKLKHEGGHER